MADSRVPPIVRRLGWVSFFTDVAAEMIYPLLPALLISFGGTAVWLGAMEGIAEAASALVKWRMGPIVDASRRKKPLVFAGYALATVARPLISLATAGWHVMILRALDRIGKGVRGVPRDALVAESVPREECFPWTTTASWSPCRRSRPMEQSPPPVTWFLESARKATTGWAMRKSSR